MLVLRLLLGLSTEIKYLALCTGVNLAGILIYANGLMPGFDDQVIGFALE